MLAHVYECHCAHMRSLCVLVCATVFAQLSWVTEFCAGGPCAPLWHQAAIVLLSWSIMSSKDWPCSGGRGPITRLITQAWLLLSTVVPGHLSLLLSGWREEEEEEQSVLGEERGNMGGMLMTTETKKEKISAKEMKVGVFKLFWCRSLLNHRLKSKMWKPGTFLMTIRTA